MSNIKRTHYNQEIIRRVDGKMRYVTNPDGTLFYKTFKTKIMPKDLPEWFLYGRYYKRFGYMSTKGIVDLVLITTRHLGTFLKDDFLLISYHGQIERIPDNQLTRSSSFLDEFRGYDDYVFGSEIMTILKGAEMYSGYDIQPIIAQLRAKLEWLKEYKPEEFGNGKWDDYIDKSLANGISDFERRR